MEVLGHHIYEYKKGLRNLVLHTLHAKHRTEAEERLRKQKISYIVQIVNEEKINIFFGDNECIDVIRLFGDKKLNHYSPEEDFILGTMLGYNRRDQCKRYVNKTICHAHTASS